MTTRSSILGGALALAVGLRLAVASAPGSGAAQGQWSERAPMLAPRSETAIAELDGRIYVLGGYGGDRVNSAAVQVYDSRSDTWAYGPPLPLPIHGRNGAPVLDGGLYIAGGASARGVSGPNVSLRLQVFQPALSCG